VVWFRGVVGQGNGGGGDGVEGGGAGGGSAEVGREFLAGCCAK